MVCSYDFKIFAHSFAVYSVNLSNCKEQIKNLVTTVSTHRLPTLVRFIFTVTKSDYTKFKELGQLRSQSGKRIKNIIGSICLREI